MREEIIDRIKQEKLIVIIRDVMKTDMDALAEALYLGGVRLMEITFDSAKPDSWQETADAIRLLCEKWKGQIDVGAGTVLNPIQVEYAAQAGARYLISPNVNAEIISRIRELGLVSIPGAFTSTEAEEAYRAGADIVKLFPAGVLGADYIKAIKAPLGHIPFLAVGGVDVSNVREYLKAGACGIGAGGKLVDREQIQRKEFERITDTARKYCRAIHWESAIANME